MIVLPKLQRGLFMFIVILAASLNSFAVTDISVTLPTDGFDMVWDGARKMVYVSLPSLNAIARIDGETWTLVDTVFVGPSPAGISLSLDDSRLFVALNQSSAVAILDLDTLGLTTVVVGGSTGTGSTYTWDVIEGQPGRLFVSANPGSAGFAYIAQVDIASGYIVSRVASNRIIRAAPLFAASPDGTSLFVGEGFSPNSLYKLDLTQWDAPIVLEDVHGSVSGTWHLESSPDGAHLYLGSGQVLRTADLTQAALIDSGRSRFGSSPHEIFVAADSDYVETFSTLTFLETDAFPLPCSSVSGVDQFVVTPNGAVWLVLGEDHVCGLNDMIFEDGFESGGLSNWTLPGP